MSIVKVDEELFDVEHNNESFNVGLYSDADKYDVLEYEILEDRIRVKLTNPSNRTLLHIGNGSVYIGIATEIHKDTTGYYDNNTTNRLHGDNFRTGNSDMVELEIGKWLTLPKTSDYRSYRYIEHSKEHFNKWVNKNIMKNRWYFVLKHGNDCGGRVIKSYRNIDGIHVSYNQVPF